MLLWSGRTVAPPPRRRSCTIRLNVIVLIGVTWVRKGGEMCSVLSIAFHLLPRASEFRNTAALAVPALSELQFIKSSLMLLKELSL
jgi:hypothetical protein